VTANEKWDGFRTLVYLDGGCKLISRNGNEFQSFSALNQAIAADLKGHSLVLDGEIISIDAKGRPQFYDLFFRRGER
jgi:ATP-dependent DNA ligase